ncbi:SlyX family protein [Bullifex porci]|uniref:SlyX family protein n=1 Tax=Bullifex porci TaxID=2606638 RepID=A0A7X2PBK8_9SPIO|nr:SlyX family protein [Bullifex porci]MDD7256478.1 SlyX family protein [Bullifex porci]MDD7588100.1 SlyX family protein [Bullifex porci]MDY2741096.1 SlyX family protein [Bullifex porci]MSU05879.1 SlyX family protein [Bullifex porci]
MNEELEQVEIKVSYLEAQVAELNEVVIEQQKNIDAMNIKLLQVTKKLEELIEEVGSPSRPNRKPPHY